MGVKTLGIEHASVLHELLGHSHRVDAPVIENLARLGLVSVVYGSSITEIEEQYERIKAHPTYRKVLGEWLVKRPGWRPEHEEGYMLTTDFGFGFAAAYLGLPSAGDIPAEV